MRIFLADGLRHRQLSGYGALARNIALGLQARGHDLHLRAGDRPWENIERGARERLQALPQVGAAEREQVDMVLQVRSPPLCGAFAKPTLIYTQNALGGLPPAWIQALRAADGIVVPSEFDRNVFARHFARVYVAGQSADAAVFMPLPVQRAGTRERFRFLYVGSYSFRKGVDLLLKAFLQEFSAEEPVELLLQCAGAERGEELRHCQERIERLNPRGAVELCTTVRSPEQMSVLYNHSDCVVTLSRGEGWCMPLVEALLCEVPVIAPGSTGMAEYLDDSVAELVPTRELPALSVRSRFGGTFASVYGQPGITYHEPELGAARAALRGVYEHHEHARAKARAGRARMLGRFSWANAVEDLERACLALLADL